jgi:hypothetical protein
LLSLLQTATAAKTNSIMVNVLYAALVAQVLTERKKPDRTYITCWVKYKAYVDTPGNGLSKDDQARTLSD